MWDFEREKERKEMEDLRHELAEWKVRAITAETLLVEAKRIFELELLYETDGPLYEDEIEEFIASFSSKKPQEFLAYLDSKNKEKL